MKRFLLHAALMIFFLGHAGVASAITITDQVGTPQSTGETSSILLGQTLTGGSIGARSDGFIVDDISWTHSYTPITGTINSATLAFDTIDMDSAALSANTILLSGGNTIGTFTGGNNGGPGPWQGLGALNNDDNLFMLSATFFPALLTGSFTINTSGTQSNPTGNA